MINSQLYYGCHILFWTVLYIFPIAIWTYFVNALTLSSFFIFWCQYLCIDVVYMPVYQLFKMYVLKTTRSVKSIPGLEPHYHKNITHRQAMWKRITELLNLIILFWKVPFCFSVWGTEPELWKGLSLSSPWLWGSWTL